MEAKKSFQLAYSLNPLNLQILVDLSSLQVQVRDYAGYRVSKQKLMNERSGNQNYWMGFIMGAYLDKKYDLCIDIINSFFPSLEQKASYQRQELLFLQADCYYQLKKWNEAIDVITKGMKWILDEDKANETLATYYLMKEELSEFDLNNLIDDNNLLYSIIIGMYKHIHSKRNLTDIIKNGSYIFYNKDSEESIKKSFNLKK